MEAQDTFPQGKQDDVKKLTFIGVSDVNEAAIYTDTNGKLWMDANGTYERFGEVGETLGDVMNYAKREGAEPEMYAIYGNHFNGEPSEEKLLDDYEIVNKDAIMYKYEISVYLEDVDMYLNDPAFVALVESFSELSDKFNAASKEVAMLRYRSENENVPDSVICKAKIEQNIIQASLDYIVDCAEKEHSVDEDTFEFFCEHIKGELDIFSTTVYKEEKEQSKSYEDGLRQGLKKGKKQGRAERDTEAIYDDARKVSNMIVGMIEKGYPEKDIMEIMEVDKEFVDIVRSKWESANEIEKAQGEPPKKQEQQQLQISQISKPSAGLSR